MAISGPPIIDFSALSQIPEAYQQGQARSRERAFRDELAAGGDYIGPNGELNYGKMVQLAAKHGQLGPIGDFAKLGQSASDRALSREIQKGNLDINRQQLELQRQKANEPKVVGSAESGFYLIDRSGNPIGPASSAAGAPTAAPSGPQPIIPPTKDSSVGGQVAERRKAAVAQGLDPSDPQVRSYILTGKMPREDQQPLTATDKKAILEADEMVLTNQGAIDALKKAKEISPKAFAMPGASAAGKVTGLFGSETGQATTELDNLVTANALAGLKAIFGTAPTEGERKILLEIQGSTSLPDAVRQKIYDRAIALAEKRMEFNKKRAGELRGGTFYKPQGGTPAVPKIGETRDGYRFKGGDPASPASWEKM